MQRLRSLEQVEEEYLRLLRVAQVKPIPKAPARRLRSMVWRRKADADKPSAPAGSSAPWSARQEANHQADVNMVFILLDEYHSVPAEEPTLA